MFVDVPFPLCGFLFDTVVLLCDDDLLLFAFLLVDGLGEDVLLYLDDSGFVCLLVFDNVRVVLFEEYVDVFIILSCLL